MKKLLSFFLLFTVICIVACSSKQEIIKTNYSEGIEAAKNGQYEQAIALFTESLNEDGDNEIKASALYNIGFCYGIMKEFDKEIEYYKKSLEMFDGFQPALYDLGEYYFNNNDLDNALKMYERLVEVNPEHEGAYYKLALVQNALGNKEEAMKNMQKAADLESPEAKKFLGEIEITPAE